MQPEAKTISTKVAIVGGGPAGVMLGLLLARSGIQVVVLEKHGDFLRDFRGDTVHPSTLEVLHELGLLETFLLRPQQRTTSASVMIAAREFPIADFAHLPTHSKFLSFVPQWEFLDFLSTEAKKYPNFQLLMQTEAVDVIESDGTIVGVRARSKDGDLTVRCDLAVAADGRRSLLRAKAALPVEDLGAPIDVLWMRISRLPDDPVPLFGRLERGQILVMLNRQTYWQCAFIIAKGSAEKIYEGGLAMFQQRVLRLANFLGTRVEELQAWDQVKLLEVKVDRLTQWARSGLLCIGDAAHAMSPVFGVGINLAIQDAVAAANLLTPTLHGQGAPSLAELKRVQSRRDFPTKAIQYLQVLVHNKILSRVLKDGDPLRVPLAVKILSRTPWARQAVGRLVGLGVRQEHVL